MNGWPEDADAVIVRIRDELGSPDLGLDGLDAVRITADLRGDDLEHLTIDASGTSLRLRTPPQAGAGTETAPSRGIRSRRPGVARRVRLIARPVVIDGFPVTADVEVADAPIDWIDFLEPQEPARPATRYGVDLRDDGAGMRATLSASLRTADVGPLLERLARAARETEGVVIRSVRVDLDQDGADGIRLSARARVRWRLLSVSARARARLHIGRDAVVTVRDLDVGSRNPVVALALLAARKTVRAQVGRAYDLNADVRGPAWHDVRVRVGGSVEISARLG